MYEFVKKHIVLMIILVSIFLIFTRTQEIIIAVLLYLVVISILEGRTRAVLTKLSIVYIVGAIIFGVNSLFIQLERMQIFSIQRDHLIQVIQYALPALILYVLLF